MLWPWPRTGPSGRVTGCRMLVKIVSLFLIFMLVLAMFGKLRMPGRKAQPVKCRRCGKFLLGRKARCDCK